MDANLKSIVQCDIAYKTLEEINVLLDEKIQLLKNHDIDDIATYLQLQHDSIEKKLAHLQVLSKKFAGLS